jgi:hypothetical protein
MVRDNGAAGAAQADRGLSMGGGDPPGGMLGIEIEQVLLPISG